MSNKSQLLKVSGRLVPMPESNINLYKDKLISYEAHDHLVFDIFHIYSEYSVPGVSSRKDPTLLGGQIIGCHVKNLIIKSTINFNFNRIEPIGVN